MKQYDIGIDLGTTSIIIATEEQGVVFRQPTICAVGTPQGGVLPRDWGLWQRGPSYSFRQPAPEMKNSVPSISIGSRLEEGFC